MSNDNTAVAIVSEPTFNERQMSIITKQIAKDASPDELAFFLEVCRMTGLNPLQRQIYAVMRNAKELVDGKWQTVKRMTIQTGIDGYRLIAARTGQLAGIDDPTYDSEDAEHPKRASVTVWRFVNGHRVPFTASARWSEYAQEKDEYRNNEKTGKKELTGLWGKMPYLMLGKCAESLALRKAFPAELSGVYTGEEMAQADNDGPPQSYVEQTPTPIRQEPPHMAMTPTLTHGKTWKELRLYGSRLGWAIADYDAELKRVCGEKPAADYTAEDKAAWQRHLEDALARKKAAEAKVNAASVTEEAPAEEPIPFDLRTLDTGEIGA